MFNYDVPESNEQYTHRIGRTGRARHEGTAYILYTKEAQPGAGYAALYPQPGQPIAFNENRDIVPAEF